MLRFVISDDIFGQINVNRLIYRTSTLYARGLCISIACMRITQESPTTFSVLAPGLYLGKHRHKYEKHFKSA